MQIQDITNHKTKWKIEKFFAKDSQEISEKGLKPFEVVAWEDNILVNTGINELLTLACGSGATKFDNANAYLGVGDSSAAATADQTDLQATTNKLRKAMNDSYPTYGTSQKATWQSDFNSEEANFAWNEMAVFNASTAGKMLNRKVSAQGTKVSGQTWRLSLEITLS